MVSRRSKEKRKVDSVSKKKKEEDVPTGQVGVLIGLRLLKGFPYERKIGCNMLTTDELLIGTVTNYQPPKYQSATKRRKFTSKNNCPPLGPGLYRVVFDDGDLEDMDPDEVFRCAVLYHKQRQWRLDEEKQYFIDQSLPEMKFVIGKTGKISKNAEADEIMGSESISSHSNSLLSQKDLQMLGNEKLEYWMAYEEFNVEQGIAKPQNMKGKMLNSCWELIDHTSEEEHNNDDISDPMNEESEIPQLVSQRNCNNIDQAVSQAGQKENTRCLSMIEERESCQQKDNTSGNPRQEISGKPGQTKDITTSTSPLHDVNCENDATIYQVAQKEDTNDELEIDPQKDDTNTRPRKEIPCQADQMVDTIQIDEENEVPASIELEGQLAQRDLSSENLCDGVIGSIRPAVESDQNEDSGKVTIELQNGAAPAIRVDSVEPTGQSDRSEYQVERPTHAFDGRAKVDSSEEQKNDTSEKLENEKSVRHAPTTQGQISEDEVKSSSNLPENHDVASTLLEDSDSEPPSADERAISKPGDSVIVERENSTALSSNDTLSPGMELLATQRRLYGAEVTDTLVPGKDTARVLKLVAVGQPHPGVIEGRELYSRRMLFALGAHRSDLSPVNGNSIDGCDSILLHKPTEYTLGRRDDIAMFKFARIQRMGGDALFVNFQRGQPVRVFRRIVQDSPSMYRYEGLYSVIAIFDGEGYPRTELPECRNIRLEFLLERCPASVGNPLSHNHNTMSIDELWSKSCSSEKGTESLEKAKSVEGDEQESRKSISNNINNGNTIALLGMNVEEKSSGPSKSDKKKKSNGSINNKETGPSLSSQRLL